MPFGLVLLIELAGVFSVAIAPQHWLRAVGVLAAGLAVAGFLRLVLSDEQAGLLRVRRRSFDVACLLGARRAGDPGRAGPAAALRSGATGPSEAALSPAPDRLSARLHRR